MYFETVRILNKSNLTICPLVYSNFDIKKLEGLCLGFLPSPSQHYVTPAGGRCVNPYCSSGELPGGSVEGAV